MIYSPRRKVAFLRHHFHFQKSETPLLLALYSGQPFDATSATYAHLVQISAELCQSYNRLYFALKGDSHWPALLHNYLRLRRIRRLLFPGSGTSLILRGDIALLIGQVDCEGAAFFSVGLRVSPTCLVRCGPHVRFGPGLILGQSLEIPASGQLSFQAIQIGADAWFGFGVKVGLGVQLEPGCVAGAGTEIQGFFPANSLILGRPGQKKATLDDAYHSNPKVPLAYSPEEKAQLKAHLKALGFARAWEPYQRFLDGQFVNVGSLRIGPLFLFTHRLIGEYREPETSAARKKEILAILFPLNGGDLEVGERLYMDLLGTVRVGKKVRIGDDVFLAGNIVLEDGVSLGNGSRLFFGSHPLLAKERSFSFSSRQGFIELSRGDSLLVKTGVKVGEGAALIPNSVITQDVPAGALAGSHGPI